MSRLVRSVLWRWLDTPGAEYFTLSKLDEGWQLSGTVIAALDGRPMRVGYRIVCTPAWETRLAHIAIQMGKFSELLEIKVDEHQRWQVNCNEVEALAGCYDIDLGITPATNTLSIRRLNLKVGERAETVAAWVRPPTMRVYPLRQRYSRLSKYRYRYEARGGSYVTALEVDDLGLVTRYAGGWERVASVDGL
ncbi:MAG TPA: hypothetical protein ENI95_02755 [Chloroflexi bacterium]|nr:hypothetical protein [Chloroflexota bacterium]